jgi:hypothetical protein
MHTTFLRFELRFSLKFQQIVEEEQDANFISRLHGGKLNIIPWYELLPPRADGIMMSLS